MADCVKTTTNLGEKLISDFNPQVSSTLQLKNWVCTASRVSSTQADLKSISETSQGFNLKLPIALFCFCCAFGF